MLRVVLWAIFARRAKFVPSQSRLSGSRTVFPGLASAYCLATKATDRFRAPPTSVRTDGTPSTSW